MTDEDEATDAWVEYGKSVSKHDRLLACRVTCGLLC